MAKNISKLFFEDAHKKLKEMVGDEEYILPRTADDILVEEEDCAEEEDTAVVERRKNRAKRNRLRARGRNRRNYRFLEDEGSEEEVIVDEDIVLEDEGEEVVMDEPEDDFEDDVVARRRSRLAALARKRVRERRTSRSRTSNSRRFKNGYDTEQLGDHIKNGIDYTVLKTKLAKVKMNKTSSLRYKSSEISRGSKLGKFRLHDGKNIVSGTIRYRANGTVQSFKVTR